MYLVEVRPYKEKVTEAFMCVNEVVIITFYAVLLFQNIKGMELDQNTFSLYLMCLTLISMMITVATGVALFIKKIIVWCKTRKNNKTLPIVCKTEAMKTAKFEDFFNNKPTEND